MNNNDGADRFDPVGLRFIEALARRATAHGGETRRLLDEKVAALRAAHGDAHEKARRAEAVAQHETPSPRSALADLVDHLDRHAASRVDDDGELQALRHFRRTWSRLSADQRLRQSLAKVPDNAGPLNSRHLLHRSLTLMRDLSPAYLEYFVSYVDTLLWLDQVNGAGAMPVAEAPRAETPKKTTRRRSGRSQRDNPPPPDRSPP